MDILSRIKANVEINEVTGCWEWQGCKLKSIRPYGRIHLRGKTQSTHRVAYAAVNGPIPAGLCVCHKCDNPPCCNPEHLFVGTHQDNTDDCVLKGRDNHATGDRHCSRTHPESRPRGERHGRAKLTEIQVAEIRDRYRPQLVGMQKLADEYGVSLRAIAQIIYRITWK